MDKLDVVKMDVPLFLRLLELARENLKTDVELHNVVTRVLNESKAKEVLTMKDYEKIAGTIQPEEAPKLSLAKAYNRLGLKD